MLYCVILFHRIQVIIEATEENHPVSNRGTWCYNAFRFEFPNKFRQLVWRISTLVTGMLSIASKSWPIVGYGQFVAPDKRHGKK